VRPASSPWFKYRFSADDRLSPFRIDLINRLPMRRRPHGSAASWWTRKITKRPPRMIRTVPHVKGSVMVFSIRMRRPIEVVPRVLGNADDTCRRRNQQPIPTSCGRGCFDDASVDTRSARSYRVWAPARDGRRRLRPWTVTQRWTPRARPPLLGKCADAFPTPPTGVHGLGKRKKSDPRLRGKGIRQYSRHLLGGRFSNVLQWPHLNVR